MQRLPPRGRTFAQGLQRVSTTGRSFTRLETHHPVHLWHSPSAAPTTASLRFFSGSASLLKQKKHDARNKAGSKDGREPVTTAGAGDDHHHSHHHKAAPEPNPEDPLNFADVEFHWKTSAAHFRDAIVKLTTRGRFTPEALGRVPVKVLVAGGGESGGSASSKSDRVTKSHKHQAPPEPETVEYPLGELAQVAEGRGRLVSILVNEEQYVKPIMSAILNSKEYNQQPQRATGDGASSLELIMKVELTRPEDAMKQVKDTADHWRKRIREARAKRDKIHKEWKSSRLVLPDAVRKAENLLQKAQEKQLDEVTKVEDETVKKLKASQL